ncbi:PREDICTED: uncharacterized protein LOC106108751 [Papilio polytes]|uniref:uncharacterized protein LOC106108751 n=1 Tax=Papilio polytes TaxID=76194 RepID=UPI0006766BCD|nr:PREDICTED: uncharacterized protein LOC106108751 [Papilio polytes]
MDDPERIARDYAACELRNNITLRPAGLYCEGTFDTWLCWPHTAANTTAYEHCPEFVHGFSPELLAHKECTENGTWFTHPLTGMPWSNYTTCVKPEDDVSEIITVYEVGYSVSLVALLLSLGILFYFKSLRCARITVHMNLFASFAANNATYEFDYANVEKWSAIDIGVAKVDGEFDFSKGDCSFRPQAIGINYDPKYQAPGVDAIVLGWGHKSVWKQPGDETRLVQKNLDYAPVTIINKKKCKEGYKDIPDLQVVIEKYMICTHGKGNLDSGGNIIVTVKPDADGCSKSEVKY